MSVNQRTLVGCGSRIVEPGFWYVAGLLAATLVQPAAAETLIPEDQYKAHLARAQAIEPSQGFGENISLRDGSLSFSNTDIELTGNGPAIRITRSTRIAEGYYGYVSSGNVFGQWELEIPRIKTMTSDASPTVRAAQRSEDSPVGWQVDAEDKDARCNHFSAPRNVTYNNSVFEFSASDWWFGYQLADGSANSETVFARSASLPSPQYKIGTASHWVFECLAATANGEPGEGFLGIAPDGSKYWFNYLIYTNAPDLIMDFENVPPKGYTLIYGLPRRGASMLVTRVEDRHGNWVTYDYLAGKLTTVSASDGRKLSLSHSGGNIASVVVETAGTASRTWAYSYNASGGQLRKVTLPDGSSWQYDGTFGAYSFPPTPFEGCDQTIPGTVSGGRDLTVTAPSGATAKYAVLNRVFGRSTVLKNCIGARPLEGYSGYAQVPRKWLGMAMNTKTISGPGLTAQTWSYSYSAENFSWKEDCEANPNCQVSVWTQVLAPDGTSKVSYFSNKNDQTENKLVKEDLVDPKGETLRTTTIDYATAPPFGVNPFPWPLIIGSGSAHGGSWETEVRWTPVRNRVVTESGTSFSHTVNSFDSFARLLTSTDATPWHSKAEIIEYHDDPNNWVLGQVAKQTVNGVEVSRTLFDEVSALPLQSYAFGKLQQTVTYNGDGTVATIKDGNNNLTIFGSWKRGIPQTIRYADGNTQSAVVNDNGWMDSVTDENGFTTRYAYDAMGRLSRIWHPNEDNLAYHEVQLSFVPVASEEHGLAAGHWRQSRYEGNQHTNAYFDALWRPVLEERLDASDIGNTLSQVVKRYDSEGRIVFQSYPLRGIDHYGDANQGIWTEYDALGRVTSVSRDGEHGLLTTLTEYLPNHQTRVTDPRGDQTVTGYQAFDTPRYDAPVWIQHPEGLRTEIPRDVFGKPLEIVRK